MMKCILAAGVALAAVQAALAEPYGDFASPKGAARENTGPLFWLHGDETEARLREYVGRVDESGQGILTIESRPHIDWMRAGWWRDVDIVLDECKKRGMKMMVFDDYWWPSQGMGGKYPIPEKYQCRDVKGTVYWNHEAPEKAPNEVARIVVKEVGKGVFKPGPDGDKTIIYTWFTSKGSYRFPTVNGLDEEAVDWFISQYYQPYYDRYATTWANCSPPSSSSLPTRKSSPARATATTTRAPRCGAARCTDARASGAGSTACIPADTSLSTRTATTATSSRAAM